MSLMSSLPDSRGPENMRGLRGRQARARRSPVPLPESPDRRRRLERLRGLYAIAGDDDPVGSAAAALDGGASVVQVRLKTTPTGAFLAAARTVVELARGRALVIVNDRADLAFLAGA